MSYICDHAFGDHIAVLLEADSNLDEKYCLQVYNNELDLIAEKYFAYQVNPVYMNESELFCISTSCVYTPVNVWRWWAITARVNRPYLKC